MTETLFKVNKVHSLFLKKFQSHIIELEPRGFLKKVDFFVHVVTKLRL